MIIILHHDIHADTVRFFYRLSQSVPMNYFHIITVSSYYRPVKIKLQNVDVSPAIAVVGFGLDVMNNNHCIWVQIISAKTYTSINNVAAYIYRLIYEESFCTLSGQNRTSYTIYHLIFLCVFAYITLQIKISSKKMNVIEDKFLIFIYSFYKP